MKNATAISHGSSRLLEAASEGCEEGDSFGLGGLTLALKLESDRFAPEMG